MPVVDVIQIVAVTVVDVGLIIFSAVMSSASLSLLQLVIAFGFITIVALALFQAES